MLRKDAFLSVIRFFYISMKIYSYSTDWRLGIHFYRMIRRWRPSIKFWSLNTLLFFNNVTSARGVMGRMPDPGPIDPGSSPRRAQAITTFIAFIFFYNAQTNFYFLRFSDVVTSCFFIQSNFIEGNTLLVQNSTLTHHSVSLAHLITMHFV